MTREKRTAAWLAGIALLMLSLSFAAVPFYDWFCRVTGFAGTTQTAAVAPDHALEETVTIRFDASVQRGMPWKFRPLQREMTIRIGDTGLAFYEAVNTSDVPVAGMASYNVAPDTAGGYFTKIHCFCFDQQVLQPGERVEMPVTFFVDPSIREDSDGQRIRRITLSYTFHPSDLPQPAGTASN